MSKEYDLYLEQHKANVMKGFDWLCKNLPDIMLANPEIQGQLEWAIYHGHDASKSKPEEYDAYDEYFYGKTKSNRVKQNFNRAWLHHIHENPHHWQHWILINDEPGEGMVILDMPRQYIIEMICDWWAFSWSKGQLDEIFHWYNEHMNYMKLSDKTRATVEDILGQIQDKLEEVNDESR